MNKKITRQSLHDFGKPSERFAIKDPTFCPNCGTDALGFSEILEKFGLRKMDDGVTRVQSWCRDCRSFRFSNRLN